MLNMTTLQVMRTSLLLTQQPETDTRRPKENILRLLLSHNRQRKGVHLSSHKHCHSSRFVIKSQTNHFVTATISKVTQLNPAKSKSEEEAWLDAVESGDLEQVESCDSELRSLREPSFRTARQRALAGNEEDELEMLEFGRR